MKTGRIVTVVVGPTGGAIGGDTYHPPVTINWRLPTLGGTAIDAGQRICFADGSCQVPAPALPAVPLSAWGIVGLAALILAWACRRPRETSAPAARPRTGGFRSQPHDDVMLVHTEG